MGAENSDTSKDRGATKKPVRHVAERAFFIGRNLEQTTFDVTLTSKHRYIRMSSDRQILTPFISLDRQEFAVCRHQITGGLKNIE